MTVNDFVRARAMDPETGRIKLYWELIAGGTAGGCQVVRFSFAYGPQVAVRQLRLSFLIGIHEPAGDRVSIFIA